MVFCFILVSCVCLCVSFFLLIFCAFIVVGKCSFVHFHLTRFLWLSRRVSHIIPAYRIQIYNEVFVFVRGGGTQKKAPSTAQSVNNILIIFGISLPGAELENVCRMCMRAEKFQPTEEGKKKTIQEKQQRQDFSLCFSKSIS